MLGHRLKIARRAAALSQQVLADRAGLSVATVSKYESGKLTPDSSRLLELAKILGVRTEFFFRTSQVKLERPEFRKRSRLKKKPQAAIEARVLETAERFTELLGIFPEAPIPRFDVPDLGVEFRRIEDAERAASALRMAWNLGQDAIADLTGTLEEHGILVLRSSFDTDQFDGLACHVGDIPLIVVGADWPGDRQRFTLAHELGHLVLGHECDPSVDLERACHRFAGAFLAPAPEVRRALGARRSRIEWVELSKLKQELGLSMAALLFRARDLQILGEATFSSHFRDLSRRGWRKAEPGPAIAPETPRLQEQLAFRALGEDMIGESKAAELLALTLDDLHRRRRLESSVAGSGQ